MNMQKLLVFLYAIDTSEKEIKKTMPFHNSIKIINCLGINLTK